MKISIQELEVRIGNQKILNSLNLDIDSGKFIGIIGPNGSGKSTLLKCIYRVLKPTKGVVILNDQPIEKYKIKETAKMLSVVAQHNEVSFNFTVEDIVLMGRSPHKHTLDSDSSEDYEIMNNALKLIGMEKFKDRLFTTLSGGERQLVLLARAITQQTRCIILDEPTNHLDVAHQFKFLNIVKDLNITVIAAIHDLNIAANYCDEIYLLNEGSVVKHGCTEKILTKKSIQDIYNVNCDIQKSTNGRINIVFYPF